MMVRAKAGVLPGALVAFAVGLWAVPAVGQSCAGVEYRVNQQTLAVDAAVGTQITSSQAAMISLDELNRARLLSAMKVMTKQQSASTDQAMVTEQKAAEATASTLISQDQALAIEDAKKRYGNTGYGACSVGTKAKSFYDAVVAAPTTRSTIVGRVAWKPGEYGDPKSWYTGVAKNGPFSAQTLFDGDTAKAGDYISFVVGPPDAKEVGTTARTEGLRLEKANHDALKSMSAQVMASVAADFAKGGPIEKMKEMSAHWLGGDGGEAWSASMAGAPERGVLQDAVRIEAANLVALAYQIKSNAREEGALAAYLLARVNSVASGVRP